MAVQLLHCQLLPAPPHAPLMRICTRLSLLRIGVYFPKRTARQSAAAAGWLTPCKPGFSRLLAYCYRGLQ